MPGVAQTGAQFQLNSLTKTAIPVAQAAAPTWVPGLYWYDTVNSLMKEWNGTTWNTVAANNYLALLTADPTGLTTIAALTEVTTAGYARQPVSFSAATAASPSVVSNSGLITFGPFTANMTTAAQWVALVTVLTGTTGFLLESWVLSQPQQVNATQSVTVAAGALQITIS